jgi:hypothetical protein
VKKRRCKFGYHKHEMPQTRAWCIWVQEFTRRQRP